MIDKRTYIETIQKSHNTHSYKEIQDNRIRCNLRRKLQQRTEDCIIEGNLQQCIFYPFKNDDTKYHIEALPDDPSFKIGNLVEWSNTHWLVTGTYVDDTIQCKGEITKCNHLLRFQNFDNQICKTWCVINDSLNPRTSSYTVAIVNATGTLQILVPYNEDTKKIYIDKRFVLWEEYDKAGNKIPAVYKVIETRHKTSNYGTNSIILLTVTRDTYTTKDSLEYMIADYCSNTENDVAVTPSQEFCQILGNNNIKLGGVKRTLTAQFDTDRIAEWTVHSTISSLHYDINNNEIVLWIDSLESELIGDTIIVQLTDSEHKCAVYSKELEVV